MPVHSSLLMPSREAALAIPRGELDLAWCPGCGFITNRAFEPDLLNYSVDYEDSQGFSPTFNDYAAALAQKLIDNYGIRGKTVLEIGCGKGDFLALLCRRGDNRGLGFDPAYPPGRQNAANLQFVQEYYSEKHAAIAADLVCCRHTLEHIASVGEFLRMLRRNLESRPDTLVLFEVPDTRRILRECAFWDFYYEHCSYFTAGSLARLFLQAGFNLEEIYLAYAGQYLLALARPAKIGGLPAPELKLEFPGPAEIREDIRYFQEHCSEITDSWSEKLQPGHRKKVVLWGSGSKAAGFLAILPPKHPIEFVVDINPHKHGKFMPGSGCRIVAPEYLPGYNPDEIIIMNPIYREEIQRQLEKLGSRAEIVTIMDV